MLSFFSLMVCVCANKKKNTMPIHTRFEKYISFSFPYLVRKFHNKKIAKPSPHIFQKELIIGGRGGGGIMFTAGSTVRDSNVREWLL